MDTDLIKQVMQDSATLLEESAALTEKNANLQKEAAEVEPLRQKVATLTEQNAALVQKLAKREDELVNKVASLADKLIGHGSLSKEKKEAFVAIVRDDPAQIVDVMEKLGSLSSGEGLDPGTPVGDAVQGSTELDPIAKFAMS
jgi:peptidoglycan hydrolase CwlO-like protein